jgi:hypothetical protein
MARTRRPALILGLLAVSALVLAGCTANGGGWINSSVGAKKATFGFTWQTDATLPQGTGDVATQSAGELAKGSWSDGYVKFRIANGGIDFVDIYGDPFNCVVGSGHYVSTNRSYSGGGDLYITICDYGEPGPTAGDSVDIDPQGGPYDFYENSGTLRGGNLQIKSSD